MAESKEDKLEDGQEEDDEILLGTLARLEDLLFDSVTLDTDGGSSGEEDQEWNTPSSKTGESLRAELQELERRALPSFDSARETGEGKGGEGKDGGDNGAASSSEEFTFEQEQWHRRFAILVEARMEEFLQEEGSSARQLIESLKRAETRQAGASWKTDAAREIVTLLREVDDFKLWATSMRRKRLPTRR